MQFEVNYKDKISRVELDTEQLTAEFDGKTVSYSFIRQPGGRLLFRKGTKLWKIDNITVDRQKVSFSVNGQYVEAIVKDEQELLLEKLGFRTDVIADVGLLEAPMPGKILEMLIQEGDFVEEGQPVIILEAMKMENELKAPATGNVVAIHAYTGDSVEKNQPLLEIEPRG